MWHVNGRKHAERMQELYERYSGAVARNVERTIQDRAEAQDICHETFLRLDRNLHRIPDDRVKAWLYCTSERLAWDYLRKTGRESIPADDVRDWRTPSDGRAEPERILEHMEDTGRRRRALERLKEEKPHWFYVICMAYLDGMSSREIGRELGVSANLASQWKHRASAWLREAYKRDGQD